MTETPQQERVNTQNLHDFHNLRRSVTDRKVAGVAGGLGRHLNIDPTILRVVFVVLCFFGGAGFLLYGVAWLFVPEDGKSEAVINTSGGTRNALLIGAAVLAAFLLVGDSVGSLHFPWPLAVLALIAFVILMNRDRRMNTQPPQPPTGSGGEPGDTAVLPPGGGASPADPTVESDETTDYGSQPPAPPWVPPVQQEYQPPAPKPYRGPLLFGVTLALVAIALGSLGLYDVAGGSVVDAAYPALALAVIGVMLVVGAWFGRAGGLTLLGVVAALALAATSISNPGFHGDRQVNASPVSAVRVQDHYYVPAGSIHLDLSNIHDVSRLDGRTIDVKANAGELVVTLPRGVDANVDAHIAVAGEADIAGQVSNGTNIHMHRNLDGSGATAPDINLNLDLVVGSIEVSQP